MINQSQLYSIFAGLFGRHNVYEGDNTVGALDATERDIETVIEEIEELGYSADDIEFSAGTDDEGNFLEVSV